MFCFVSKQFNQIWDFAIFYLLDAKHLNHCLSYRANERQKVTSCFFIFIPFSEKHLCQCTNYYNSIDVLHFTTSTKIYPLLASRYIYILHFIIYLLSLTELLHVICKVCWGAVSVSMWHSRLVIIHFLNMRVADTEEIFADWISPICIHLKQLTQWLEMKLRWRVQLTFILSRKNIPRS